MNERYTHIKIRLLLREHLSTVLLSLLFFYLYQDAFLIFFIAAFLIFSLVVQFTSKKKFLADIVFNGERTEMIYLTPNLKLHKEELDLSRVSDAEVARAGFLIKFPMEFNIKYQGEWRSYYVIDKRTVKTIDTFFDAANISF